MPLLAGGSATNSIRAVVDLNLFIYLLFVWVKYSRTLVRKDGSLSSTRSGALFHAGTKECETFLEDCQMRQA